MTTKETSTVNGVKEMGQPLFSLCHTTARVKDDGWRAAVQAWKDRADHPELVEHVFVTDEPTAIKRIFQNTVVRVNGGRKCCVDGWNQAARFSTGKFLINIADDLFPPEHWDTRLLENIDFEKEQVLDVDTNAPDNFAAGASGGLITFCFITRKYYERYGYILYPEYISVYSDNDFSDQARRDGVVVNCRHLKFDHRHPLYDPNVKTDAVYENQSRSEAWDVGRKVYLKRSQSRGFTVKKKIMVCLPGEHYSSAWVTAWTELCMSMTKYFDINPIFCYSTNVHVTRAALANAVVQSKPSPDYVLWIDDDNLFTFSQLATMIKDLEDRPEIDSVSAWTWIAGSVLSSPPRVSVGMFDERGDCKSLDPNILTSADSNDLIEIGWSGFPVVLMRFEALVRAGGHKAFQPYIAPNHPYGFYGEDSSFCVNAKNNGVRMFVDKRIKVPHLKMMGVEPIIPTTAQSATDHFAKQEAAHV